MSESGRCPACGAEMAANAAEGLCPACLLKRGLERPSASLPPGEPTAASPPGSGFAVPTAAEIGRRLPQLEILELLGQGGMGAVYKARQTHLDRLVALKVLPPEVAADPTFAERFTREARALARLSHPHIVMVYDFGQADGLYFLVMEFVDGVNLRQAIQAGQLTPRESLAIVGQVCDALQFAHDEGIVHRDIKPENILVDKRGRVKIADFGLAKLLGREPNAGNLTGTHQVMGTLHYMAPEQMLGSRTVDHRADIYSLGVVLYELLTGELPLGRFEPPSQKVQIDVRLDEVVLRALAKEPERRYQQASAVKTDIDGISAAPLAPAPPARPEGEPPWATWWQARDAQQKQLMRTALWVVLLVCAAVFGAFSSRGTGNAGEEVTITEVGAWDPWLTIEDSEGAGFRYHRRVHWFSGSMLCGLLGLLALNALIQIYRLEKLEEPEPTSAARGIRNLGTAFVANGVVSYWSWLLVLAVLEQFSQVDDHGRPLLARVETGLVLLFLYAGAILLGVLQVWTGLSLRRLERPGLARAMAMLSLLPLTPAVVVSWPVALWALLRLRGPNVQAVFQRRREELQAAKKPRVWAGTLPYLGFVIGWCIRSPMAVSVLAIIVSLLGVLTVFYRWSIVTVTWINSVTPPPKVYDVSNRLISQQFYVAGHETWAGRGACLAYIGLAFLLLATSAIRPLRCGGRWLSPASDCSPALQPWPLAPSWKVGTIPSSCRLERRCQRPLRRHRQSGLAITIPTPRPLPGQSPWQYWAPSICCKRCVRLPPSYSLPARRWPGRPGRKCSRAGG
jgi:predicted Ser/Thr protein kinase